MEEDWHVKKIQNKSRDRKTGRSRIDKYTVMTTSNSVNRSTMQKHYADEKKQYRVRERALLSTLIRYGEMAYARRLPDRIRDILPPVLDSDFKEMNKCWDSTEMTDKLAWQSYWNTYSKIKTKWDVRPVDELTKFFNAIHVPSRIADLGCGDAELKRSLLGKHGVDSYDLHSTNPDVIAANIDNLSEAVSDSTYDYVVFSLSLLGKVGSKLREAHRILKPKGTLIVWHICSEKDQLQNSLVAAGFNIKSFDHVYKFVNAVCTKNK